MIESQVVNRKRWKRKNKNTRSTEDKCDYVITHACISAGSRTSRLWSWLRRRSREKETNTKNKTKRNIWLRNGYYADATRHLNKRETSISWFSKTDGDHKWSTPRHVGHVTTCVTPRKMVNNLAAKWWQRCREVRSIKSQHPDMKLTPLYVSVCFDWLLWRWAKEMVRKRARWLERKMKHPVVWLDGERRRSNRSKG